MARESILSNLNETEKAELIAEFNEGNPAEREELAAKLGYSSEKSLRNSMAAQWGKGIFTTARNNSPQQKAESVETMKAKAVPVKFSSLWSSMSGFVADMPKSVLTETGEIDSKACEWLQAALDAENANPFIVSINAWPRSELESILLLLSVESAEMKAARLSREAAEKEADKKRVEALEAKGFIVIGAESKVTRMIDYHANLAAEIDGEVKKLNGKPEKEIVNEVRRKLEVSGRGHVNMVSSLAKLEADYNKAVEKLTAEIEKLKSYNQSTLQVDSRLQTAMERISKLLPQEPKKPALTDVQQAAIAAMVAAGLSDAQARAALGL